MRACVRERACACERAREDGDMPRVLKSSPANGKAILCVAGRIRGLELPDRRGVGLWRRGGAAAMAGAECVSVQASRRALRAAARRWAMWLSSSTSS